VRKDYDPQCLQPYLEYHEWTLYFFEHLLHFHEEQRTRKKRDKDSFTYLSIGRQNK
jgi:hypothetical protein